MSLFDITRFTEDYEGHKQYDYRMLIHGNYTFRDNLEADSYVLVLHRILDYLNSHYNIYFTVLTPEIIKSLSRFSNVEQKIYPLPTYSNTMRAHFDADQLLDILDWKRNDYDIVYSHVPEHTAQIANIIYNNTHLQPKIIGYSHWFEIPENTAYEKDLFPMSLVGMLEAEEFGVNSNWLKTKVMENAKLWLSTKKLSKLDKIIQPHYLGTDQVIPRNKNIIQ